MQISINLGYLRHTRSGAPRSLTEAAGLCRSAGFRSVDYLSDVRREDWKENALAEREILEKCGLTVGQTHLPYNRYAAYPDDLFPEYVRRAIDISGILGASCAVIHADEYRARGRFDPEEVLRWTCAYLEPFAEQCEARGLVLAVENLFEDVAPTSVPVNGRSRFTSRIDELLAVIRHFGSPSVACCWDFGHARCAFGHEGQTEALRRALPFLVCTHVHDNYDGSKDLHLLPFLGRTDWETQMRTLKEGGYKGKLSFELVYGCFPDTLVPKALSFAYAVGERLNGLAEDEPYRKT